MNGDATLAKVRPGDIIVVTLQNTAGVWGQAEFTGLMTGKVGVVTPTGTSFTVKADPAVAVALSKPATTAAEQAEITITFTVDTIGAGAIAGEVNIDTAP